MTLRLVALMSIVLLLSLAAFGLVMNHYQDQVMQEVARTASDVGRATLRAIDLHSAGQKVAFGMSAEPGRFSWVGEGDPYVSTEGPADPSSPLRLQKVFVTMKTDDGPVREIREFVTMEGPGHAVHEVRCSEGEVTADCGQFRELTERLRNRSVNPNVVAGTIVIDLQEVRAEHEGQYGLMLKIPTLTRRPVGGDDPDAIDTEWHYRVPSVGEDSDLLLADNDEIQLPIEIGDYRDLYRSLRDRSLFLFLGVFVVGTVLSAGLATRFTRPIRRLDAGIRQISEGDLDVEVAAQGNDEIARLGMAFNEMTLKLRMNRDRGREMIRREKFSALGGLAAGVAHDVRNPLHSIGLTLQHLRDTARPESPERAAEFDRSMDIIRGEIRRLDQTVANFLRFSRSERRERQPVDLADLLNDTARLVRKEAEWRKIDIQVDALSTLPAVSAEGESLRASLLNLVLNAFDAMPDGGKLSLTLKIDRDAVVIEVTDDGRGIPAEDLDRVFEFAYTTRDGGNGVGLAMVHHCVVEEHGGRVSIESEVGRGTRVRLALPIRAPEREEQA